MKRIRESSGTTVTETASAADVDRIVELLRSAAPGTIPLQAEEVRRRQHEFRVLRRGDEVVGVAALRTFDSGHTELGSVVVEPSCRGQGIGLRFLRGLLDDALREGRELFCYTFSPGFFERLGFRRGANLDLPDRPDRPLVLEGKPRLAMCLTAVSERRAS